MTCVGFQSKQPRSLREDDVGFQSKQLRSFKQDDVGLRGKQPRSFKQDDVGLRGGDLHGRSASLEEKPEIKREQPRSSQSGEVDLGSKRDNLQYSHSKSQSQTDMQGSRIWDPGGNDAYTNSRRLHSVKV
ncbi:hypothetical protein DPMN_044650 [Dreissena polymorpha]|uniref:Uncharacterized protein n=1 Tax=Dreissena polymorpha TaxID=45954 RepID=A0A9D4D3L6_DREPO|nr:hypothetical protein DPMN_044650 [Dreissena polymorpha]